MFRNRPLVNSITGFLALLAFICLLLCTVSSPIVRGINLFRVSTRTTTSSSNGLEEVSFGVLGGCGTTSAFRSSFGSSARAGSLVCTSPELSYEILTREMYQASQGSYTSRSAVLVDHNTTSALIMNPITAGLAGLGMILACIAALVRGRVMHGASLTLSTLVLGLAALLAWGTWGLNLAIILLVRNGMDAPGGGVWGVSGSSTTFRFQWGAVMPLSLIAAVLLSVAVIFSTLSFFLTTKDQTQKRDYTYDGEKRMGRGSTSSSY